MKRLTGLDVALLERLEEQPQTVKELCDWVGEPAERVRTRLRALQRRRLVFGLEVKAPYAKLWLIEPAGRERLESHG